MEQQNSRMTSAEIYEEYGAKVLNYLLSRVNNRVLAEDLRSDVFLKIDEKLDTYDPQKSSLSTWIFTIVRHTLIDHYRTRRVMEEIPETMPAEDDVEESVCTGDHLETLAQALKQLDERERDIIILHYYSGQTLKSIAERLGISYAYVKLLHNKALAQMKGFFGD